MEHIGNGNFSPHSFFEVFPVTDINFSSIGINGVSISVADPDVIEAELIRKEPEMRVVFCLVKIGTVRDGVSEKGQAVGYIGILCLYHMTVCSDFASKFLAGCIQTKRCSPVVKIPYRVDDDTHKTEHDSCKFQKSLLMDVIHSASKSL